jgi:hypothetical protein
MTLSVKLRPSGALVFSKRKNEKKKKKKKKMMMIENEFPINLPDVRYVEGASMSMISKSSEAKSIRNLISAEKGKK